MSRSGKIQLSAMEGAKVGGEGATMVFLKKRFFLHFFPFGNVAMMYLDLDLFKFVLLGVC